MGKDVTCRIIIPLLEVIEKRGIPYDVWHKDLSYNAAHLCNKQERIEWQVYYQLLQNLRTILTDDDFEAIGRDWARNPLYRPWAIMTRLFFTTNKNSQWVQNIVQKTGHHFFSNINYYVREFSQTGFSVELELQDGYSFCREHFLIVKGAMSEVPFLGGRLQIAVTLEWTRNGAIYTNELKKNGNDYPKFIKALFSRITTPRTFYELVDAHEDLLRRYQELETARTELAEQTVQLHIVNEISKGIHPKLNLERTLDAVVRALVDLAGFAAAQIHLQTETSGQLTRKAKDGRPIYTDKLFAEILTVADKQIGTLQAWPVAGEVTDENRTLFEQVAPTISMAIHDAYVYQELLDYQENLEKKVEQRTAELWSANSDLAQMVQLLEDAQTARDRFFANVSHELRTPLTLILAPLDELQKTPEAASFRPQLERLQANASLLLDLINELLDFSALDADGLKLKLTHCDLLELSRDIIALFTPAAEQKNITLTFESAQQPLIAAVDVKQFGKVIVNVLANALKFTPPQGKITVKLGKSNKENNDSAVLEISDNGCGIDKVDLEHIFDRFYQSENASTTGTGIGLALCKELMELHGGDIQASSEQGHGSRFTLTLPIKTMQIDSAETKPKVNVTIPNTSLVHEKEQLQADNDAPRVLIVEDHEDMRDFLCSTLAPVYATDEAEDGKIGLAKAIEIMPDLVLCDIMMPGMDGFELCRALKSDERTCHIPVILLTARAAFVDKITGLETGADDYIIKPFQIDEVKLRIKNLLEQRRRLREKFSRTVHLEPGNITVTSLDEQFLHRVINYVLSHLGDEAFSIKQMAHDIGLSRMHLHRKLKALTNENTSNFVRIIRLKRAAQLLAKQNSTVTEIAYQVGFQNPSFFSACFRNHFGMPPSKYSI